MSAPRPVPTIPTRPQRAPGARRTTVVLKRVGPWSVFRFSLLFYLCMMIAVWLALGILYHLLGWLGVLDAISRFFAGAGWGEFAFNGWWIFSRLFAAGLVMVVFGAVVNLFVAMLYNLISDFTGGIEVTLGERR